MPAFADTETTEDVTEKSAGATHKCVRTNGSCTYDPRTDIWSDGGSDDDIVYWDQHGHLNDDNDNVSNGGARDNSFSIMNDISTFLTEEQMLAGFTMDSAIGVRDRNSVGGDPFTVQIKVTDGTTTYSDTQEYTMAAGSNYTTLSSQLIVPENSLSYSLATFGLILDGASLTNGYAGPQTNSIGLTATYELQDSVAIVTNIVNNTIDDILTDSISAIDTASMDIDISTPSGNAVLNIPIVVSPSGVVLSVPSVSGDTQKIEIKTGMSTSDSPQTEKVADAVAEVESEMEESESSSSDDKKESSSTEEDKEKAVQVIVARVLQAVEMAGGDTDGTKLALMGILNNSGFREYQRSNIPDVAFYDTSVEYESAQIPDLLGGVLSLGEDSIIDQMRR
jgi:hypothetical protein